MRLLALLLCALLLGIPAAALAPAAQDDNGTGADAPEAWTSAVDVPLAAIAGTLDPAAGDREDWYRVAVPAGKVLVWTYHSDIPDAYVYVLDDAGGRLSAYHMWNFFGGNGTWDPKRIVLPGPHVRIGVAEHTGGGTYWIELEAFDLADVSVDQLTVRRGETPAGEIVRPTLQQVVQVDVSNLGAHPTRAYVEARVHAAATGASRHLGTVALDLAPGQKAAATFRWSGAGQAGEMRVEATATSSWTESRTDNNALSTAAHVLVNRTGFGVDALNGPAWASDGRSYVQACVLWFCPAVVDPVGADVDPTGDAHGGRLAVSGTGGAYSDGLSVSATGPAAGLVALSGTGPASGVASASVAGPASGYVPVSVLGESDGLVATSVLNGSRGLAAVSGAGDAEGDLLAASATGDARCSSPLCVAVSGAGDAEGDNPFSVLGRCNGGPCVAVSPTGNAQSEGVAVSGTGQSRAPVAASGLGHASGNVAASGDRATGTYAAVALLGDAASPTSTISVAASGAGSARGGQAASGTGDAECDGLHCNALSGTGDATSRCTVVVVAYPVPQCAAISATGRAECTHGAWTLLARHCLALGGGDLLPPRPATPGPTGPEDAALLP